MKIRLAAALTLVLTACQGAPAPAGPNSDPAPTKAGEGASAPAPAPAPTVAQPSTPAIEGACAAASLSLAPQTVVARVNGAPVTVESLGVEAAEMEKQALGDYCRQIQKIRDGAVRMAVEEKLLQTAAAAQGLEIDPYLKGQIESRAPEPSDAEVEAYYGANKTPDAPALELVRGQVVAAMMEERQQGAYFALMGELREGASVEMSLPDVRPPALPIDIPAHTPTFGGAEAKVEVVEFSDFECPYCARAGTVVSELKGKFGDRVRFAYRHFPLSFHPNAKPAAEHAQCAQEQGKFWEMHDAIFENQRTLDGEGLKSIAAQAGLDADLLARCLESGRARKQVDEDVAKGTEIGVRGTPSFYINGQPFDANPDQLEAAIAAELAKTAGA